MCNCNSGYNSGDETIFESWFSMHSLWLIFIRFSHKYVTIIWIYLCFPRRTLSQRVKTGRNPVIHRFIGGKHRRGAWKLVKTSPGPLGCQRKETWTDIKHRTLQAQTCPAHNVTKTDERGSGQRKREGIHKMWEDSCIPISNCYILYFTIFDCTTQHTWTKQKSKIVY